MSGPVTSLPHDRPPLLMLRLLPDLQALSRWAAATGQSALRRDVGYALHAALQATMGNRAPKPFALLQRPGMLQFIGYCGTGPDDARRAIELAATSDPLAAQALGLSRPDDALIKQLPDDWRSGETLSFEVRVAPVVRTRAQVAGGYPEIDASFHPAFAGADLGERELAHGRWLARELARGGAATLLRHRASAFRLTDIARRARDAAVAAGASRRTRGGLLPDLTVVGQLRVDDGAAFHRLLARGLGRHRSFGFGCLLVAPAGAWT